MENIGIQSKLNKELFQQVPIKKYNFDLHHVSVGSMQQTYGSKRNNSNSQAMTQR
jgi:hypothetical protein